jgi:hypothetical protein
MSDKVTMKALDTLHISNVQNDNINEGDVFIVTENDAKALEKRGLAERGGSASKALNADRAETSRPETREEIEAERGAKSEKAAPANKAEASAPANKTISAATAGSSSRRAAARKAS